MTEINAIPNNPPIVRERSAANEIKPATPDLIIRDENGTPIEYLTDLLFQQIGGQEFLSVSRSDIIAGQDLRYTPIKNITEINSRYNSRNIFQLDGTWEEYFSNFEIKFENYYIEIGDGPNGEIVYIDVSDPEQPLLVVCVNNVPKGIDVEIQVMAKGELFSDIIYIEDES
jgi:hypothetical protein